MFTGIITDVGRVRALAPGTAAADTRIEIATGYDSGTIAIGASIACSGVCLTVIEKGPGWFAVEASAETLARTTVGEWEAGRRINLERALRLGDELGGHLVSGHVDTVARIVSRRPEAGSMRFEFEVDPGWGRYIAPKGSVGIDGISLTINEVADQPGGSCRFGVNVIPHTQSATTLGEAKAGDRVNVEIDLLARYVDRLSRRE